jgi:hypothetical protein
MRAAPVDRRHDQLWTHPITVLHHHAHHRFEQRLAQIVRLQSKVQQARIGGVVVVLFLLDARVRQVIDRHIETELLRRFAHRFGETGDIELLGELIEHTQLAARCRIEDRKFDTRQRIANIEEAARLPALAVHRQRQPDDCLHQEPIERRTENPIVIEARRQTRIESGFRRLDAVDYPLIQVSCA